MGWGLAARIRPGDLIPASFWMGGRAVPGARIRLTIGLLRFAIPLGDGLGIGFHPPHEGWQGAVLIENPLWATVTGRMPSWPGSR